MSSAYPEQQEAFTAGGTPQRMKKENTMKKRRMKKRVLAIILALPTLAVLMLAYFSIFYVAIVGIPAVFWLVLGIAGYVMGARLLRASQSHGKIALGVALSMLPILIVVLAFFFGKYVGP
jgi:uncharacterized RDD family membrane protein YckC